MRYYIDTSIWMDVLENRNGRRGEPLGKWGSALFFRILANEQKIFLSTAVLKELSRYYSDDQVSGMVVPFLPCIERIDASLAELEEAERLSRDRGVPFDDALHAILARNYRLLLITRDTHFRKLVDIVVYHRPEDFL